MMNFKSELLKLSIIFMLILVLIPAATAMDSDDAFYIEYDHADEEEVVVEHEDVEAESAQDWEVESSQDLEVESSPDEEIEPVREDVSSGSENIEHTTNSVEDDSNEEIVVSQVEEDTVAVPELNDNSDYVTHDIDVPEVQMETYDDSLGDIIYNNNETSDDRFTLEDFSINVQGSFYISNIDLIFDNYHMVNYFVEHEITTLNGEMTCVGKNLFKVMELKDILLTNDGIQSHFNSYDVNILDDIALCMDKITSDFAYSIDNSIVGDENAFTVIGISHFLNFYLCFNAIFSRSSLDFDFFFSGDFLTAAEYFCIFCFVEYSDDLSRIDYTVKFCLYQRGN